MVAKLGKILLVVLAILSGMYLLNVPVASGIGEIILQIFGVCLILTAGASIGDIRRNDFRS